MRGSSSVGRVSASQAECRGFESRLPLHFSMTYWFFKVLLLGLHTICITPIEFQDRFPPRLIREMPVPFQKHI